MFVQKPFQRVILGSVLLAGSLAAAHAQETNCRDPQTQADMNICASKDYKAADAKLNASYKALTARYADDQDGRKALVEAQRAWIKFRDAQCNFATIGATGGSIRPMLQAGCLEELTEERTKQLDAALNCEEGDVTCS